VASSSPSGFAVDSIILAELDRKKWLYRIEGFMWHQGDERYVQQGVKPNYGKNLKNFLAGMAGRDLKTPNLKILHRRLLHQDDLGMDNRENMYAIRPAESRHQLRSAAEYIPTSQCGGNPARAGLHYHYGTLGNWSTA